jgi:hypothetical protein
MEVRFIAVHASTWIHRCFAGAVVDGTPLLLGLAAGHQ